jgi:CubicO group peptidase (beta-lactamase class C family)
VDTLDQIVSSTIDFWKVPGCAVSVVSNNEVVLAKGYGVKVLNKDPGIDEHTAFPIASLTKLFTAATVGILVDRRKLDWDTPIRKDYPSLKLSDAYATSHLTYRDCLAMRSGLPGPSAESFIFSSELTSQQLLKEKLPKLLFSNGFRSHFAYQNLLYLLAAAPFSSWVDFLEKEILGPLSMKDTLTHFFQFQQSKNKTALHKWENDHFCETPAENLDSLASAAGLFSSAHDMALFLSSIHTCVSAETLKEIFTPQITASVDHFLPPNALFYRDILFPDSQFLDYGFGCFIHDYRGIKIIQVPGLTDGAASVLSFIPNINLSISILSNADSVPFSRSLLFQIIDAYLGQQADWNTHFLNLMTADRSK